MQSSAVRMAARRLAIVQRAGARRSLATAAVTHAEAHASAATPARKVAPIPLSNVEAQWATLSEAEQAAVHEQLEVVQQKDWKTLSLDEKKAAYYVAFGPHGPRAPTSKPGDNMKIVLGVGAALAAAAALNFFVKSFGQPLPKTVSKEWEEASNARALEMKLDPISGISSEGYKGKGFVQSK